MTTPSFDYKSYICFITHTTATSTFSVHWEAFMLTKKREEQKMDYKEGNVGKTTLGSIAMWILSARDCR